MRSLIAGASMVVLMATVGCHILSPNRPEGPGGGAAVKAPTASPTVENLVEYLNNNAKRIEPGQAVNCTNMTINIDQGGNKVGVSSMLVCQAPRNFRMSGVVIGNPAVEVGSNDKEFWFWCRELKEAGKPPYLYHCTYDDLAHGVNIPFPFQPDMALNALGVSAYDATKQYNMKMADDGRGNKTIELAEKTESLQKTPIWKVTVFDARQARGNLPQVLAHIIKDEQGRVICRADIRTVQQVGPKGFVMPKEVVFNWPEQKLQMVMRLENPRIVPMAESKAAVVFSRQNLNHQSVNLATQTLDGGGVQRAGATYRAP
jgi:hypothetical protein